MPDPQWYTKQGPDGKWYTTQSTSPDEAVSKMQGAWGATKPPEAPSSWYDDEHLGKAIGVLNTGWTALNTPVGDFGGHAGRTQSLITQGMTMGLNSEEAEKKIQDIPKGRSIVPGQEHPGPKEVAVRTAIEGTIGSKSASVPKTLADMFTTPLAIGTFGVGGVLEKLGLREIQAVQEMNKANDALQTLQRANANPEAIQVATQQLAGLRAAAAKVEAIHKGARAVEGAMGAGFGAQGGAQVYQAAQAYQAAKTPSERMQALADAASGGSQALLGTTAMVHGTAGVPDIHEHFARVDRTLSGTIDYAKATDKESITVPSTTKVIKPEDDIRIKIAQLKADIAKAEAVRKPTAEPPKVPQGEDTVEAIRRGAPDEVKPPAAMPNQVPEEQRASVQIKKEAEAKMASRLEGHAAEKKEVPRPVEPAPEVRPEPSIQDRLASINEIAAQRAANQQHLEQLRRIKATGKPIEATGEYADPNWVQPSKLQAKQMEMKNRIEARGEGQASVDDATELIKANRKAKKADLNELRSEAPISPPVGREAAPPETAKPDLKPLPPTQTASRSGEPVRAAEKPSVNSEPRSVLGDKGSELGQRPPVTSSADLPAPKRVLNPQERLQLLRDRVVELQKKYPNISKTRLAEMAAEQLRKEQGSLGGDLGGDRRVRREEKINAWIKMIQDPKASAEAQQTAFKMLKAFGVEDDEIIRRASGAEEFAKTEGDRLPEPSPEALSERIGDPREFSEPRPAKEQERSHLEEANASLQEAKAEFGAQLERHKIGEPDISGVKSPAVEELDRMYKLKDQRGSLSFRRLSPEEKSEASPVSRLLDGLANVFDKIASRIEHPRLTDEQFANRQVALNVLRNATATKALEEARLVHILHDIIQRHDNPINERQNYVDFMDAAEGKPGAKFLQPEDQAVADELKQMYKDRWPRIAEVKGWDEGGAVENYLSRLWSDPKKAERLLNGIVNGKRPLEGYPAFTHERVYKYASEAMAHGLEPITWNPIRQQLAGLFQVDKFLMAHEQVKAPLKDVGLVKWYKHGGYGDVPSGWTRIDDKIFNPKSPTPEGLLERGAYFAPAEVAEVVNRYLGPGLERSQIYRGIRHYSNLLNAATLGLSGYHGAMISWVSQTSDVALGLQRLSRGESGGARDLLRGSIGGFILQSVRQDYRLGKAIQAQALDPITEPGLQRYVDNLTRGGGRIQQDATYALKEREGFMNWLRLGAKGRFDKMLGVGLDKATAPIMKKFVPRIKLGIAGRMMEAKMRELNKLGIDDQHTINTELGKIWDSVDNRAGQMVQDNLSWNPIAKDLANVAIRAVGWDFGSLREYGGAIGSDTSRQFGKILRGQRPELTARMAFTIATPITVGLMGGAIHYYMTGKMPSKVEDCIFPGPDGAKISWPNYAKDMYNFTRAPLKTAIDKLHPTWSQAYEAFWSNADFYGTEIRHPGDPLFKQGIDTLKWYSTSWTPLGIRGIQKRMERGEAESSGTGLFGFMPAPQTIGQSKAEELAGELARRRFQEGPRSAGDTDRYSLVRKFQFQVANGTLDKKALVQAWQAKRLQDSDVNKIYSAPFKAPKLVVEFKDLKLPDALAVMRDANPNERVQLAPYLLDKYSEINNYPDDQARQYVKQINSYIGSQN